MLKSFAVLLVLILLQLIIFLIVSIRVYGS